MVRKRKEKGSRVLEAMEVVSLKYVIIYNVRIYRFGEELEPRKVTGFDKQET